MINKFLKSPFGYFCFWLATSLISTEVIPFFLPRAETTAPTLLIFISMAIGSFLIAVLYTVFIYKEIFTAAFKKYALRWIMGFVALILIIRAYINPLDGFRSNTPTPIAGIIVSKLLAAAIILSISYVIEYYLLTWGNALGLKFLSKSRKGK